jgi:hypothetical protein
MALAAVVVLAGAIAGFLPLARARGAEARVQAAMIGFGLRMLVTVAGVGIVWFTDSAPHLGAFLASAGATYAVLLVLEVVFATRLVATGGSAPDAAVPA